MKNITVDLENIKCSPSIERAFIFGSYINNITTSNDIDIILFSNKSKHIDTSKFDFSLPINRIQYNCYAKQDKTDVVKDSYDIVVINDNAILDNFIEINSDRIIEI